jgi:hypothetical protein
MLNSSLIDPQVELLYSAFCNSTQSGREKASLAITAPFKSNQNFLLSGLH